MSFSKLATFLITSLDKRQVNENYGFKVRKVKIDNFSQLGKALKNICDLEEEILIILDIQSIIEAQIEFLKIRGEISPFTLKIILREFKRELKFRDREIKGLKTVVYFYPPIFPHPRREQDEIVQGFYMHFDERVLDWQLIFKTAKMHTMHSTDYARGSKWVETEPNQVWNFERMLLSNTCLMRYNSMILGWTIGLHCSLYAMSLGRNLQPEEVCAFLRRLM